MTRRARRLLFGALAFALLIAAAGTYVLSLPPFGGKLEGDRLARARANPQYHDDRFVSLIPPAPYDLAQVWDLLRGQFCGKEIRVPPGPIPVHAVAADALKTTPAPSLRAFWMGTRACLFRSTACACWSIPSSPNTPRRLRSARSGSIRRRSA